MKHNCESHGPAILMLVQNELFGSERWKIELHLLTCSKCRAEAGRLRKLTASLAAALSNPSLGARTASRGPLPTIRLISLSLICFSLLGWFTYENLIDPSRAAASAAGAPCPNSKHESVRPEAEATSESPSRCEHSKRSSI